MLPGRPSRTALGAARHRAVHQVLEHGAIFCDPLALAILGAEAEAAVSEARGDPTRRRLRLFIALRTRLAEDALAAAVERGVRQVVILGAGLDTYAYRGAVGEGVRVFEVDHPATQAWKRQRLAEAGILVPAHVTFAPVDFERETLAGGLAAAGLDASRPAFFTWLGVVPYLTEPAVVATLGYVASLPKGSHVVFDYANPPPPGPDPEGRFALARALAARAAAAGEPFQSHFETGDLCARLRNMGFVEIEDFAPARLAARYFPGRTSPDSDRGAHVLHAAT